MKEENIKFPLTNEMFNKVIKNSFIRFISSGTSRSTSKLKPLHGSIAKDIAERIGDGYEVISQGYGEDKECSVEGRYNDKMVDVTVCKDGKPVSGVAVKFIMQNYSQNSNNYFENMLGETVNLRSAGFDYYQLLIIFDRLPHYKKDKTIVSWETFSEKHIEKYRVISNDDPEHSFQTPNKTLICHVHIPEGKDLDCLSDYIDFYKNNDFEVEDSKHDIGEFGDSVIINDYEKFIDIFCKNTVEKVALA